MSGVVGIHYSDGRPLERSNIDRMVGALAHRGPDGTSVWCDGSVGLGHCMLRTTPESLAEILPFYDREKGLAVTADARIDNREELIRRLSLTRQPADEISDSQIILAAYDKWGESCTENLLGDFAFAIWDGRRGRLFCARDPVGVKPFYYHHAAEIFAFASEIKAILCLKGVPRRLNELKVADFLVPFFNDQTSTYYKDIFRLPPAHNLVVADGKPRVWSYWKFDPAQTMNLGSDREYMEGFRELLTDSVHCRARSAYPVGSALSGGLDSSSIACIAGRRLEEDGANRLHTFSAIFPSVVEQDPRIDESAYMEAVLANGAYTPHYVNADRCQPLADVSWYHDEAWPAPSLYMSKAIFRTARDHDVRVLLSGFDGDVTVSYGYELLEDLARSGKWSAFAREAEALAARRAKADAASFFFRFGVPPLTELAVDWRWGAFSKQALEVSKQLKLSRKQLFLTAGLRPAIRRLLRGRAEAMSDRSETSEPWGGLHSAIDRRFADRVNLRERVRSLSAIDFEPGTALRERLVGDLTDGRIEYTVNVLDHTAAMHQLEPRYPFLDRRLMEFCLALPFEQKLRDGWTRAIFRFAMEGILPPEVQWRVGKANLSTNVRLALLKERDVLDRVILDDPAAIEDYVDIPALRGAYSRYLAEPATASEGDLFTVFLSVNLALWLSRFDEPNSSFHPA